MQFHILGLLSFLSDIMLLVVLLWHKKQLKNPVLLTLACYAILSVIADIFIILIDSDAKQLAVFGVVFMEVAFIGLLYYFITETKKLKITILVLATITLLYFIIFAFEYTINTFPKTIAAVGILNLIIVSLITTWDVLFASRKDIEIKKRAIYLIIGYLIYASGNLFLCMNTEQLNNIFSNPGSWAIFLILNTVKNCFFTIAVLFSVKKIPATA